MKFYKKIVSLSCLLLLFACQGETVISPIPTIGTDFFNIPAFFKSEAERLSRRKGLTVYKTVSLDGKTASKQLTIEDWSKELALFSKLQIHGRTQREKYKVDSSFAVSGLLKSVHYTSDDKKSPAKSVLIDFNNNRVSRIEIRTQSENEVYDAAQTLIYEPEKGYKIEKIQQVVLQGRHDYSIELRIDSIL